MPEKIVGQMYMKRWITAYAAPPGVVVRAFSDPDVAFPWLKPTLACPCAVVPARSPRRGP